jgi:aminobenzoyl-glutamate utilization protein A
MNWQEMQEKMVAIRRDLHAYPESGWMEFRTSSIIASALEALGFDVFLGTEIIEEKSVMGRDDAQVPAEIERALSQGADREIIEKMEDYTGVVGYLDTGREGPEVSLRFDIDAVDVSEAEDEHHRPFREGFSSRNPGVMHSCGHDGHTAIGLVLAEIVASSVQSLKGRIKFIFQPAEEGVRGGKAMTDAGLLDNSDFFLSLHLGMGLPSGSLACGISGLLYTKKFDVRYTGKASHAGAAPQNGRNALLAAASTILNLHAISPHSGGATRINVGLLKAGEGRNVIPPAALMKIETRGENDIVASYIYKRAEQIIKAGAEMYEVDHTLEAMGESVSAESSRDLVEVIYSKACSMGNFSHVERFSRFGGSDDVAWMMKKVQEKGGESTYIILGSDIAEGHHNRYFDFDESVMVHGLKLLYSVLKDILAI